MTTAKYNEWFGGWVAFKHGKILTTKHNAIKVFRSEEEALKAANKSRMGFSVR